MQQVCYAGRVQHPRKGPALFKHLESPAAASPTLQQIRAHFGTTYAANALIGHFEELRSVKLRVGALPQHPNNVLKYSLTWSTEGLINEYGNLCLSVVNGEPQHVQPPSAGDARGAAGLTFPVGASRHSRFPVAAGRSLA